MVTAFVDYSSHASLFYLVEWVDDQLLNLNTHLKVSSEEAIEMTNILALRCLL
ncbi:hypothetical protein HAX54_051490, partial [Datura stramonium]|nr:hypothetical protein [Datura stramonium]